MINRVLIRMKTVQLLYSYLLVEKPFSLESQPSAPTKEKRFAYNLYLDIIYLIDRVANRVQGKNKSYPLGNTRFVICTEQDERIKSLKIKYPGNEFTFAPVEDQIADKIKESLLFKEFEKGSSDGINTDHFWEDIVKGIILPDKDINNIIQNLPGYSLSGVDRMKNILDATFQNFYATKDNVDDALKSLKASMQKARDLYIRLLALPVELTKLRKEQLTQNMRKVFAKETDLNPNTKFIDNKIPSLIEKDPIFAQYIDENKLSWWIEDKELLEILLKSIIESDVYSDYMSNNSSGLEEDSEFWRDVLIDVILNNKDFLDYLENKSVFWNDDLEIMTSFVVKTLKRFVDPQTQAMAVLPMYKDGDKGKDALFGSELFRYVVNNKDLYRHYIEEVLSKDKWNSDRLAFMDVVITMTALAEIINYPEIPLKVSINEYIEIAKSYSSEKSGQFIHGLLSDLIDKLQRENIIKK